MKLFSRIFPQTPQPPSSPIREPSAAPGDEELSMRIGAIRALPDGQTLRELSGLLPGNAASTGGGALAPPEIPAELNHAAQARMAQLIDEGGIDFGQLLTQAGNRSALFGVAVLCKHSDRLPQALASIDDPAQLARLVTESPSSRLRQLAAEKIEERAQIDELIKQVRSKDKNVYKILKQKHDVFLAEERRAARHAIEVVGLCESLERHGQRAHDPVYESTLAGFESRWRALAPRPDTQAEARAQAAIDRCHEVIAEHVRESARLAAQQAEERAAREAHERELQASREAADARAVELAKRSAEEAAAREALEAARAAQRAVEELARRQLGGLIRKAFGALSDGNTKEAAGLRRAIEEKRAAAGVLPAHLGRLLEQLDEKLNALKQWKDFAVAPKRIELIQEMESLVGSTEDPPVLAERIKSLQQDWRTISKGIVSESTEDWERFHRASQSAYEPCRRYFEAQAKLRHENLEKRKALLERVTAFEAALNAQSPDWRLLARVLREAPREWRQYFPVDREPGRSLQADFDASIGRLQARLDVWHAGNAADKQSLITRARHMLTLEDGREAIEGVKELQGRWKETAPASPDKDQSLWNEFREICDAAYQKRQQAFAQYSAGLEAAKAKALALCQEAESIAASTGTPLLEGSAKIGELRAAFDALEEMPRGDARGIHDRFERALDRIDAQIARQKADDVELAFTKLFEAGRRLRAYEWSLQQQAEAAEREALKQGAEAFIAGVQYWPKAGLAAIKECMANAAAVSAADAPARERALRLLCVRSEILSETPTPEPDETLRRQYQVQRLMQGMGQGLQTEDGDWDAMAISWIRIAAVAPAIHESLEARFLRCRAKRPVQIVARPSYARADAAAERRESGGKSGARRDGFGGRDRRGAPGGRDGPGRAKLR